MALSIILWRYYLEEVFSGRSIPLALTVFLFAVWMFLSEKYFWCGLLFGFAALIRFDYLAHGALALICGFYLYRKKMLPDVIKSVLGFLLGLMPWAIYSYTHFGKFWISDSSWIAFSALPGNVLDFPAATSLSALNSPLIWIARIIYNILPFVKSFLHSIIYFPILIFFGIYFCYLLASKRVSRFSEIVVFLLPCIAILIAATPYLLTGYFDERYFAPHLIALAFVFCYSIEKLCTHSLYQPSYNLILILSVIFCVVFSIIYMVARIYGSFLNPVSDDVWRVRISSIAKCHQNNPNTILIFKGGARDLAFRYGAITGLPATVLPNNFDRMTDVQKKNFFIYIGPFSTIENFDELQRCKFFSSTN